MRSTADYDSLQKKPPAMVGNRSTISQSSSALQHHCHARKVTNSVFPYTAYVEGGDLRLSDPTRVSKEPCKESFTSAAQYTIFLNIHHRNHHDDER